MTHLTVGRLAPTPSGRLHLGNVCAFAAAWLSVRAARGRLLLRIEDVDTPRARQDLADGIRRDLDWLGLTWDAETPSQSARDYEPWLRRLDRHSYHCTCTRAEIQAAGGIYDGRCRTRGLTAGAVRFRVPGAPFAFVDRARGPIVVQPDACGDPILRRRDGVFAYNLAVVADDIADGVTEIVRGADLMNQTAAQAAIWAALGHAPPTWMHLPLILGPDGRKLSKSHRSSSVADLRHLGWTPAAIWRVVLPWLGVQPASRLEEAVESFHPAAVTTGPWTWTPPA